MWGIECRPSRLCILGSPRATRRSAEWGQSAGKVTDGPPRAGWGLTCSPESRLGACVFPQLQSVGFVRALEGLHAHPGLRAEPPASPHARQGLGGPLPEETSAPESILFF